MGCGISGTGWWYKVDGRLDMRNSHKVLHAIAMTAVLQLMSMLPARYTGVIRVYTVLS